MPIECYRELLDKADREEKERGRTWYADAHKSALKIAAETGSTVEKAVGVIAVLSPMVEWNVNLKAARLFLRSKGKAKRGIPGFATNRRKAKEVMKGNFEVIRGPKVRAFFETLLDPEHPEPVIDTQMIAAFYDGTAYRDDFRIVSQSKKRLEPIREAVKLLAEERGEPVSQVQATIWITFKRTKSEYANQLKLWR